MLANAIEILMSAKAGVDPQWDLEDFRYRIGIGTTPGDDPDFDPLAAGAQSADLQEAILRQIAARFE
jgi:hypothetical protein